MIKHGRVSPALLLGQFGTFSQILFILVKKFIFSCDFIFLVKNTLLRPNWEEIALIYKKRWNWRHNYSIHLFSRFIPYLDDPDRPLEEIRKLNSTYGEIANFILSELSKTTSNNKM